jgi:exonuclease VII large subunit
MSEYVADNKPLSPDFVPSEPEPQTPAAVEPEAWTGPSQEEWQQWQQSNEYIAEQLRQAQQALTPQEQAQLDPFADNFQSQLDAYIAQKIQPYEELRTNLSMGEAEERANDILVDLQSAKGEFVDPGSKDIARAMAERFLVEEQQRYGLGAQAAEAALERGYEYARERENKLGELAVQRHLNQLKTLNGAPRQPGVSQGAGSTAVQQHVIPEGGDEMSVVRHYGGYGR